MSARAPWLAASGLLLAYAAMALSAVWTVPFPNGYDELAHLSYAVSLAQTPWRELDLPSLHLLRPELGSGFGPAGNYLNHPPGFYLALGTLLPSDGWPTMGTVRLLRLVNAALSITAVGLALAVGLLRRLELPLLLLYGACVVLVPVMQATGSGISNDNLALLGGCTAVLGAQLALGARRGGTILLILGCVLATLAKFTAAIMLGVFAGVFLLTRIRQLGWGRVAAALLLLAAAEAVAGLPYLPFVLRYGSPVPVTPAFVAVGVEAASRQLTVNGWMPGAVLSLPAYAVAFGRWLLAGWSPVLGIEGLAGALLLLIPGLTLLGAMPGFVLNPPGWRGRDPVLGAACVALLLTLLPHLVFSWQRYHLALGAPPFDAAPRYYLPLALAAVPAALCWTLQRLPPRLRWAAAAVLTAGQVGFIPLLGASLD